MLPLDPAIAFEECDRARNDARLTIVGDLAERFAARVIGIAAQAEILPIYYEPGGYAAGFVVQDNPGEMEDNLAAIKRRLQEAEERFRSALKGRAKQLEWRSSIEDPVPYIANQCRAADLLVIGKTASDERQDPIAQINPSCFVHGIEEFEDDFSLLKMKLG